VRAIYQDLCSACHRADGTGVPYLIPNLADSSSVSSREPTSVLRVVIHGAQSVATQSEPTGPSMPAFGWQLTDAQVAAVTTYIRNSWGHAAPVTATGDVHKARKATTFATG
jgi:mono/diheme cytochrome c family protein